MAKSRRVFLTGFLLCLAMLLIAGYFQFVQQLEPCPLCILQRASALVAGCIFLLAALHNPDVIGTRIYGAFITVTATLGAAVSARHVWLQNLPAGEVPSCGPGLNFILENFPVMEAFRMLMRGSGECAEVLWTFLGLSIPAWTLVAFVIMALMGLSRLFAKQRYREWI